MVVKKNICEEYYCVMSGNFIVREEMYLLPTIIVALSVGVS